jgi:uncharacterized membrane protein
MTAVGARAGGLLHDRRVAGAALAAIVFLVSWVALDHWFFSHGRIVDTPYYQSYGLSMRNGEVPYRDFEVDYPPGALPVFLAPTYVGEPTWIVDYQRWFARIMAACGLLVLAFVILARPPTHGVVLVALSPLLAGSLILSRFDLWPAAFVAAAVAALVADRHRLGWLALACAITAKVYAVVLLPLAIVWTLRRRGRGELGRCLAIGAVTVAAVFLPFAIVAPHGLWQSLWGQVSRPLQVESTMASLLTTFGNPHDAVSHHSVGITGHGGLEALTTVLELGVLVALWVAFARGTVERERLVRYAAACVCAFVVLGKVLSPQYLIWLVALVALVRGTRGLAAAVLLGAAMITTQYWFAAPRYEAYIHDYSHAPLVLLRNLMLVALLAVLALSRGPRAAYSAP